MSEHDGPPEPEPEPAPAARSVADAPDPPRSGEGGLLVRLAWWGTALTCVTSVVNAATGDRESYALSAAPALVLFTLGCGAFLWAFAVAVERSRTEVIGVGGLFFLSGCAPRAVQRSMLAALAVQTTVPVAVAVVRPFTAFATLSPVWVLGLSGLWGARHGTFPARVDGDGDRGAPGRPDAPD